MCRRKKNVINLGHFSSCKITAVKVLEEKMSNHFWPMRSKQSELRNNWVITFDTRVIWGKLIFKTMVDKDQGIVCTYSSDRCPG